MRSRWGIVFIMVLSVTGVTAWSQHKGAPFSIGRLKLLDELRILVDGSAVVLQHPYFSAIENNRCLNDPKVLRIQNFCESPDPGVWAQVRDQVATGEVTDAVQKEAADLVTRAWRTSREQISRSKFSAKLRAKLTKVWDQLVPKVDLFQGQKKQQVQVEGFDYANWEISISLESIIAARTEFHLRSTEFMLHHEFGHALTFLLSPGKSSEYCLEQSAPQLTVCPQVREVMSAMTDQDRQLMQEWVACIDRRTVYGEWLSVRSRLFLPAESPYASGPGLGAVVNRRGEALADDWAMGVLRFHGKSLAEKDLWPLCRTPQGKDLLKEFRDPHPESLFRVQVLGEQVDEVPGYWTRRCDQLIM